MLTTPMSERDPEAASECSQTSPIIHNVAIELESGEDVGPPESKLSSPFVNTEREGRKELGWVNDCYSKHHTAE